jgi:hypothetical protein
VPERGNGGGTIVVVTGAEVVVGAGRVGPVAMAIVLAGETEPVPGVAEPADVLVAAARLVVVERSARTGGLEEPHAATTAATTARRPSKRRGCTVVLTAQRLVWFPASPDPSIVFTAERGPRPEP